MASTRVAAMISSCLVFARSLWFTESKNTTGQIPMNLSWMTLGRAFAACGQSIEVADRDAQPQAPSAEPTESITPAPPATAPGTSTTRTGAECDVGEGEFFGLPGGIDRWAVVDQPITIFGSGCGRKTISRAASIGPPVAVEAKSKSKSDSRLIRNSRLESG
jgi:hypothetical protein